MVEFLAGTNSLGADGTGLVFAGMRSQHGETGPSSWARWDIRRWNGSGTMRRRALHVGGPRHEPNRPCHRLITSEHHCPAIETGRLRFRLRPKSRTKVDIGTMTVDRERWAAMV